MTQISEDVNYIKLKMDEVVMPALNKVIKFQEDMAVVSIIEFEKHKAEIRREIDKIYNEIEKLKEYNQNTSPGTKFSNMLTQAWLKVLIGILTSAATVYFILQSIGAFK